MTKLDEVEGFVLPISRGLTEPNTMAGGDRKLMILNVMGAAVFMLVIKQFWTAPFWIILYLINLRFTKKDPFFFESWINHLRYKNYYNS